MVLRRTAARWRVLALCSAMLALVLCATVPAAADTPGDDMHADYLALGDSVAFGYNPFVPTSDPTKFVGYPDLLSQALGSNLTNAACPGEASGGFISLTGTDLSCRAYRANNNPLHVSYSTSQLDFAVTFLQSHLNTRLVTLNLGSNDVAILQNSCTIDPNPTTCFSTRLPGVLSTLRTNLDTIYHSIRQTAGYTGLLVALTYYAPVTSDPTQVAVVKQINGVVKAATIAPTVNGKVADGFTAFVSAEQLQGHPNDPCAAGLLIVKTASPLVCNIHPSLAGHQVLAGAIRALDSTSPVITPQVNGTVGSSGWYTSDVSVNWSVTEAESAVTSSSGCSSSLINTDTTGTTLTCSATSLGGTSTSQPVTIKRDATAPVVSPDNVTSTTWRNTPLAQDFTASDATSGLANPADSSFTITASGESPDATTPVVATHDVTDNAGNTTTRSVSALIDSTPPSVSCSVTPSVIWPPNRKLVPVQATVTVNDGLSGPNSFELISVTSNEPITPTDIQGFTLGTASTSGMVRAERLNGGTGRIYTLTYRGADVAGNTTDCQTTVRVPHNRGH